MAAPVILTATLFFAMVTVVAFVGREPRVSLAGDRGDEHRVEFRLVAPTPQGAA